MYRIYDNYQSFGELVVHPYYHQAESKNTWTLYKPSKYEKKGQGKSSPDAIAILMDTKTV